MPPTQASGASPYTSIGPPSPEVTGVFCRVPSPRFSRSPWYSLPDHLCRFRVRAAIYLARRFSWQHRIIHFAIRLGIRSQTLECGFAYIPSYTLTPGQPSPGLDYLPASLHCLTTTTLGRALHSRVLLRSHFGHLALMIRHGRSIAGTGISTSCPSTTPVGLALGPDLPWAD